MIRWRLPVALVALAAIGAWSFSRRTGDPEATATPQSGPTAVERDLEAECRRLSDSLLAERRENSDREAALRQRIDRLLSDLHEVHRRVRELETRGN